MHRQRGIQSAAAFCLTTVAHDTRYGSLAVRRCSPKYLPPDRCASVSAHRFFMHERNIEEHSIPGICMEVTIGGAFWTQQRYTGYAVK